MTTQPNDSDPEVAESGLGVGETLRCAECGHVEADHRDARVNSIPTIWCHGCSAAVPRWAVMKNGEAAYEHCEHSFKHAPPSASDTSLLCAKCGMDQDAIDHCWRVGGCLGAHCGCRTGRLDFPANPPEHYFVRTPNPIPDQVLTPLSADEQITEAWTAWLESLPPHYNAGMLRAFEAGWAAALAGVPKEAGE